MRVLRCSRAFYLPRAGAPGKAAQAVQPPASLVAEASVCLQTAPPNAQCVQALCCLAHCLTLQSRGRAPASRVTPLISNVRHRGSRMHSLAGHREVSTRCECRFARGIKAVLPRAVRPSAASAPLLVREALVSRTSSSAVSSVSKPCLFKASMAPVPGGGLLCNFWPTKGREVNAFASVQLSPWASRRSARPGCSSRAATSFARGGGFGLFASGATQRTMRAGSVPLGALPNHSINRTCPGKPGHAGYLKR